MSSSDTLLSFYSDYSEPRTCPTRCDQSIYASHHDRFLVFLALCQKLDVAVLQGSWQAGLPTLGSGGTSVVSQGLGLESPTAYAFKRLLTPQFTSEEEMYSFRNMAFYALTCEMAVLSNDLIKMHPHIIELLGVSFEVVEAYNGKICVWPVLIFEKADWSTLADFVPRCEEGGGFDMEHRISILLQVWAAVAYMHGTLAAMHGDIKPSNVLVFHVDGHLVAKVSDFGYSSMFAEGVECAINIPMSVPWYAPELKGHSGVFSIQEARKTEVFSLGVFALWLLFGTSWASAFRGMSDPMSQDLQDMQDLSEKDRWTIRIEELKEQDELVRLAVELLRKNEHIENRYKVWMERFFRKTLPSKKVDRANSVTSLLSELRDVDEFRLYPSVVLNNGEELELVPDVEDYPRLDPSTEEEKVARESWGQCVQLDATLLFEEFSDGDYRIRRHLVERLEFQAGREQCFSCQKQAAAVLAVFYELGFGCSPDSERSHTWLIQSSWSQSDLEEAIESIKTRVAHTNEAAPLEADDFAFDFPWNDLPSDYLVSKGASTVYKELTDELTGLEASLGRNHSAVYDMRFSLLRVQELRGCWSDVEKQARALIEILSSAPPKSRQQIRLWSAQSAYANCLGQTCRVADAETIFCGIYDHAKDVFGADHMVTLGHLRSLCAFWMAEGEFEKVESKLKDVPIENLEEEDGMPKSRSYARLMLQSGGLLTHQGRYSEAETVLLNAIKFIQRLYGATHPETLDVLKHLTGLYIRMGRLEDAEKNAVHVSESWQIIAQQVGEASPQLTASLQNLAEVYSAQSRFEKALSVIRNAVRLHDQFFGAATFDKLILLDVEAFALLKMENLEEGIRKQKEVTDLSIEILGRKHRQTWDRNLGLAAAYSFSGNSSTAEEMFKESLNELQGDEAASYFNLMICNEHLTDLYQRQNKFEDALGYALSALKNAALCSEEQGSNILRLLGTIADLYEELKDLDKVLQTRLQILDILETHEDEKVSTNFIEKIEDVGNVYFDTGDYSKAEIYYKKALSESETQLDTESETYNRIKASLAATQESSGSDSESDVEMQSI